MALGRWWKAKRRALVLAPLRRNSKRLRKPIGLNLRRCAWAARARRIDSMTPARACSHTLYRPRHRHALTSRTDATRGLAVNASHAQVLDLDEVIDAVFGTFTADAPIP